MMKFMLSAHVENIQTTRASDYTLLSLLLLRPTPSITTLFTLTLADRFPPFSPFTCQGHCDLCSDSFSPLARPSLGGYLVMGVVSIDYVQL